MLLVFLLFVGELFETKFKKETKRFTHDFQRVVKKKSVSMMQQTTKIKSKMLPMMDKNEVFDFV